MQCAGIDTVYYVGDQAGTAGRAMAVFNANGDHCGSPGSCGNVVYPPETGSRWECWSTGPYPWNFQCGSRPYYSTFEGGGPGAGFCLVCPPRPRAVNLQ